MEERATKKRKIFGEVLPPEIIENIVLVCPNTIVMQALACTCKQIKALVVKAVNKAIELSYAIYGHGEEKGRERHVTYTIRGDGTAVKSSELAIRTKGSSDEKSETAQKMFEDRFKFINVYNEVLGIMNMKETSKFAELIEQNKDDPFLDLQHSNASFYIEIDHQDKYHATKGPIDSTQIGNFLSTNPDPQNSWKFFEEEMRRLDARDGDGFDLSFNDSGHLIGYSFEIDSLKSGKNQQIRSLQLTPSFVDKTFVEVEKFLKSKEMIKFMQKKSSEMEDETSADNLGSDLENEERSGSEDDDDEENDSDEEFQGRRTVQIEINGLRFKQNLPANLFGDLMEVIQPITEHLETDLRMDYE